jgi:hypothetical protein
VSGGNGEGEIETHLESLGEGVGVLENGEEAQNGITGEEGGGRKRGDGGGNEESADEEEGWSSMRSVSMSNGGEVGSNWKLDRVGRGKAKGRQQRTSRTNKPANDYRRRNERTPSDHQRRPNRKEEERRDGEEREEGENSEEGRRDGVPLRRSTELVHGRFDEAGLNALALGVEIGLLLSGAGLENMGRAKRGKEAYGSAKVPQSLSLVGIECFTARRWGHRDRRFRR